MPEGNGNMQSVQDHAEEQYTWRTELYGDRRNFAKAMDLLMIGAASRGTVDLKSTYKDAIDNAMLAAGLTQELKNASAYPLAQDKTAKEEHVSATERATQTLSEDTTQNVIDKAFEQVSKTMSTDIQRTIQEGLASLSTVVNDAMASVATTAAEAAAKAAVSEYIEEIEGK